MGSSRAVYGVLVTYRRPELLARCLDRIAGQTLSVRRLIVVDNHPDERSQAVIRQSTCASVVDYLPAEDNVGPAGGFALGMQRVLQSADDNDLLALFDDNDPLPAPTVLSGLVDFLDRQLAIDPRLGAVGMRGANFDWRRGRARTFSPDSLGSLRVDHLYGGYAPIYRVEAVRRVGVFSPPLFFGFEELEYGSRLVKAGYSLYMDGDMWQSLREDVSAADPIGHPQLGIAPLTWRRYYSLRNLLLILLDNGRRVTAVRVALVRGVAKPLVNLVVRPKSAWLQLVQNVAAIRDAFLGNTGRVVVPTVEQESADRRASLT